MQSITIKIKIKDAGSITHNERFDTIEEAIATINELMKLDENKVIIEAFHMLWQGKILLVYTTETDEWI